MLPGERAEQIQNKGIPDQDKEIKKMEEKIKKIDQKAISRMCFLAIIV